MNVQVNKPVSKKNRHLFLSGEFNESQAQKIITDLLELELDNPTAPVLLTIDSYGGFVDSFIAIHDVMKMVSYDISTLCIGKAMSCGQMALISGTKGKRFITPNARVMIHQVSSATWGPVSTMQNHVAETSRLQTLFEKIILDYTKLNKKQLHDLMKRDSFLTAQEAVKYGFVDKVIRSTNDIHKLGIHMI